MGSWRGNRPWVQSRMDSLPIARAIHDGRMARELVSACHSGGGRVRRSAARALLAWVGPIQASARIAAPAGLPPRASIHCGACFTSTSERPSCSFLVRPDVRKTSSAGTCLVSPRRFAALAPCEATMSPLCSAIDLTTLSGEGGRAPDLQGTGATYVPRATRSNLPSFARREKAWSIAALLPRCRNSLGERTPPSVRDRACSMIDSGRFTSALF